MYEKLLKIHELFHHPIIRFNFNDDRQLNDYLVHEQESNQSYIQNYENISNRESFYKDEQPNESDIEYFNE